MIFTFVIIGPIQSVKWTFDVAMQSCCNYEESKSFGVLMPKTHLHIHVSEHWSTL